MNYKIFSASMIAVSLIMASLISRPAIGEGKIETSLLIASTTTTFEGTLLVKEGDREILVRSDDGHQRRLKVLRNSVITRNGKPAEFGDLQVRDQVSVSYDSKSVVVELEAIGS